MPVRIRLRRVGRKKQPSYRIVVAEGQSPRGGAYIDNVGFYNPRREPAELRIDLSKVELWIARGAQVTPTVQSLIKKARTGSEDVAPPQQEAAVAVETPAAEVAAEEAGSAKKPAARKTASKRKAGEAESVTAAAEAPEATAEGKPEATAAEAPEAAAEETPEATAAEAPEAAAEETPKAVAEEAPAAGAEAEGEAEAAEAPKE